MPHFSRLLLLFTALSFSSLLFAQSGSVTINWETNAQASALARFGNSGFDLEDPEMPRYYNRVPGSEQTQLSLGNWTYRIWEGEVPPQLQKADLPAEPEVKQGYGAVRGQGFVMYSFIPYVKRNGQVCRVISFRVEQRQSSLRNKGKIHQFANNSVLSSGDWYKFSLEKEGMYKFSPGDLAAAGIDIQSLNIYAIRLFGNGQAMLPTRNSAPRKDDLQEIAMHRVDQNNNGIFDGSDYLLFFGKGPHQWQVDNNGVYTHNLNDYRERNFYFLSINNGLGQNPQLVGAPEVPVNTTVSAYDDYDFKHDEKENLVGTGKDWLGDVFDFDLQNNYGFSFPDLLKSEVVRVKISAVARSSDNSTKMEVYYNGGLISTLPFAKYGTERHSDFVEGQVKETNFNSISDNFTFNLQYNNTANPSAVAWLNYIEVQVRRAMVYRNKALIFRDWNSVGTGNVAEFQVNNANANLKVWDVTDINAIKEMSYQLSGTVLTFAAKTDSLREFAVFGGQDFPTPTFVSKVENQNLHAMAPAELYIVTHAKFKAAADRLAEFHRSQKNRSVEVVDVDKIFNEFSSGGQDITAIRDFMRMLYTRNNGGADDLKYLMLFGDASYDYRAKMANNTNYVPLWQSEVNYSLYNSTISDDYYGNLDPGEGNQVFSDLLDIGIGRLPCESLAQAQAYVDKVLNYSSGTDRFGDWRNKILFLADDVDIDWETKFVRTSEYLEDTIRKTSNSFVVEKIYTDAYKQVSTSGSETYPEASKDMFRKVQQGNLVTNYIGHGGEIGLSSEKLLQLSDINGWTNFDALPLFMTITCEFTRFDDPKRVSAGEQLILNPRGGAIALVSTTRVVYADPATDLNRQIFSTLLTRPDGEPRTLGEIIMDAKNKLGNSSTKLKFSLFGDPTVQLAIPYYQVQTTALNNKAVNQGNLDTLKALSKINLEGMVTDLNQQKLENFNGVLNVSVFDKPNKRSTLKNDGIGSTLNFELQNNLIYKGKVEVKNGDFKVEFLVPKDIAYQFGYGKISYYAEDGNTDAAGVFDTVYVGGSNKNAAQDDLGPEVLLYMNDESFVRGGITGSDPELFAILRDSSGINTVGNGIGHDLVAILDNNAERSYVINEYYEADLNSYKSGEVRYPLYDLEQGNHHLKLKVFDVYNNYTEAETEFVVADDSKMALDHVLNYPNPFTTYTEFQFEHNRAFQPLDIQVQIFSVSGRLVKTINTSITPGGNRITGIAWDGLDDYGDKIGKGVYIYRLKVRSQLDNTQAEKYEKLVILR